MGTRRHFISTVFIFLISNAYSESFNSGIGSCDSVISSLVTELEYDNGSPDTALMCRKVSKCLNSLDSESSRELKELYDSRCEKYEFYGHGMMDCYQTILEQRELRELSEISKCLRTDPIQKRNYFNIAQPCILQVASQSCTTRAFNYLKTNYDEFLDYLTIEPENGNCENLQVELNRFQCRNTMNNEHKNWLFFRNEDSTGDIFSYIESDNEVCWKFQRCSRDTCNIFPLANQLRHCEIIEAVQTDFFECLMKNGNIHPVEIDGCSKNNEYKDCVKSKMAARCGSEAVIDFDKRYEWFNTYNLKQEFIDIEIKGNYTELEEMKTQDNGVTEDSKVGKCAPVVDELVTLLLRRTFEEFSEHYQNANETCSRVKDCFKLIGTPEAQKLQQSYQVVCDRLEFTFTELISCVNKFYENERKEGNKSSDFVSKNLTLKREAFTSKKEMFLEFAESKCIKRGIEYLTLNYEKFVDFLTTESTNDRCKSIPKRAENELCIRDVQHNINYLETDQPRFVDRIFKDCQRAKKCVEQLREKNNEADEQLTCQGSKVTRTASPELFLTKFIENKECLKFLMFDNCGTDATRHFNENFNNAVKRVEEDRNIG
ncbi:hypothetical protein GCK72_020288 [Caenorhabditis remanei]|uniref:T20D4.11-like domain-containing protein n=1 Tax=Caenorhabditis remanei TaxID=31234 RepID=A0A6A5GGL3_CAERE|nr:hypothetical protein GCK72_020288 [Caenorhabditis remanei]KAF1753731.1 hypothetical protein GCK72_020288 [Caenorhabditis remanei]